MSYGKPHDYRVKLDEALAKVEELEDANKDKSQLLARCFAEKTRLEAESEGWECLGQLNDILQAKIDALQGNMGFDNFISVAETWLENYPPDIFDGSSGDKGPLFVVALREALAALKENE